MVDYSNIQINLVSRDTFEKMTSVERLQFIISEVKQGKVLILEQGLTATEQFELNKLTMSEIDHESFIGIEMPGFVSETKKTGFFDRLFRRRRSPRMMAIGPASLMRIIKKEPSLIQTVVMPVSGIISDEALGEGIPIDEPDTDSEQDEAGSDGEEGLSEPQLRLEEFSKNTDDEPATQESDDELKMLIGPELQENSIDEPGVNDEFTSETPDKTGEGTNEKEETIGDEPLKPSNKAQGVGEPLSDDDEKDEGKGYLLRKIKEEGEEN